MKNNESKTDKYDYFDVTADIGFYAYGKSIEEAYENAGLAMFNVITDISKVKKEESREFEIVSEDLVSLLYDYLEELLFLQDTEFLFFSDFKVNIEKIVDDESSNLENYKLTCFACGEEIDWNVHSPKSEVKAITFHKMCVKEDNGVFKLRAILDL
ncbi:archease [uncultured Methanobrevibacter sp.]|uniref:archease n=1 Tax=uncultured Methanobrevibacter sp. TaxID=253161 RepID=UPI0025D43F30|nr:archease [uncultured Methanobrevibacter sp.]